MGEKYSDYVVKDLKEPNNPLEKFAKKVFDKLIEEGIPPIPTNYSLYFFNMLEDESPELKKMVQDILSLEESGDIEKELELEKKLKMSFKYLKEILQKTAAIYKLTNQMKLISDEAIKQMSHMASQKAFNKYLKSFEDKIDKFSAKMDESLKDIKEAYSKNIELIKDIESNSIFDMVYGVYNEKYFNDEVCKEIELIKKFKYISSVIFIKVRHEVLTTLKNEKSKIILNRSVAKILLKTSRRTDIVAHVGNGVFGMLLRHTDRIGAIKTVERFSDILSNSAIFLEGNEIDVKIAASICELRENKSCHEYMDKCKELLAKAQEQNVLYVEGE